MIGRNILTSFLYVLLFYFELTNDNFMNAILFFTYFSAEGFYSLHREHNTTPIITRKRIPKN